MIEVERMVAGLVFDYSGNVALIEKTRPNWQKGNYNAIGGHIEDGETPYETMVREFREETGLYIPASEWRMFCVLTGPEKEKSWEVSFFTAVKNANLTQTTDERPEWVPYHKLPHNIINNLTWLIPMALARSHVVATVREVAP